MKQAQIQKSLPEGTKRKFESYKENLATLDQDGWVTNMPDFFSSSSIYQ